MTGALALLACASGCLGDEPANIASEDNPLYILEADKWEQRDIPVCWDTAGFATEKDWVKNLIRGQRSWAAVSGVNFTGWGTCASTVSTGIRIRITGNMRVPRLGYDPTGVTEMELDFGASPETSWTRCISSNLGRRACIEAVTLHEFGHALSFAHEHNRPDDTACTEADEGQNGDTTYGAADQRSIMSYCSASQDLSGTDRTGATFVYGATFGAAAEAGDFNGDGRSDLLCHDVVTGAKMIDLANSSGHFYSTDWTGGTGWCNADRAQLFHGDFNGDGLDDLLCHEMHTGKKWIDYAADGADRFTGTDWSRNGNWCKSGTSRLYVADFNGDHREDLLCHEASTGKMWIDYADTSGRFYGTDWSRNGNWCKGGNQQLFTAELTGDDRADLLCHDRVSGSKWIDYADGSGHFEGTDWSRAANWCKGSGAQLFIGDFNGDGTDDMLCHDANTGSKWIDFSSHVGRFEGTDWSRAAGWCTHAAARLSVGDYNGDGRDDILCHDVADGRKWIDFANSSGQFWGTNWSRNASWCAVSSEQLL